MTCATRSQRWRRRWPGASYDANGSLLGKERDEGGVVTRVNYRYDLRNRLEKVDADGDGDFADLGTITYGHDSDGNRVSKWVTGGATTLYVVDSNNPTGYAQVVEEKSSAAGVPTTAYAVGLDVIQQAQGVDAGATTVHYLLYDGHGSTRAGHPPPKYEAARELP